MARWRGQLATYVVRLTEGAARRLGPRSRAAIGAAPRAVFERRLGRPHAPAEGFDGRPLETRRALAPNLA